MTPDLPPQSPVDGIAAPADPVSQPAPVAPASSVQSPKPKQAASNIPLILFGILAVIYAAPALFLMAVLPRPDGSMQNAKLIGTAVYGGGALVLLLFGLFGLMRVSAIKDRPRLKLFASLRLAGMVIPLLLLSGGTVAKINIEPSLALEVVSPTSVADLIAPVSVTFGMENTMKLLAQQKLTPLKEEWDFNGDGVVDQETFDPSATYLFTKAGVYVVAAKVTTTDGQSKKVSTRLVIPRASFGVSPAYPIIEEPATFSIDHLFPKTADAKTPKLLKAKWDFDGDGVTDLETDKLQVSTTYHKLGPVSVSVTMTLTNQTQSTLQRTVTVSKPPDQPFPIELETEPQTLLGPPPFGVLFVLKTKEPIANATWDFGNQKNAEGLRVAQIYATVGNYTVNVVARSQSGAVARLSKIVRVTNPLEIRDLTFEGKPEVKNFTIDGELPVTVDITPITAMPLISFSWDAPNATEVLATDKSFHAVYRDEGKYFVDLIGMDPDQNVYRRRITINANAAESSVTFSMDPATPTAPATVRFDASDTYIANGEEITGFEWDFGDNSQNDKTKFSGSAIEHLFEREGTYVITLNVRTISGRIFTGKQTLVVRAPVVDTCFMPSRRSGKAPLGVRFDTGCSTGEFQSWLWDFGDNSQSDQQNPTHVYLNAGEYKVTLTAVTKDGLKSMKTSTISVTEQ